MLLSVWIVFELCTFLGFQASQPAELADWLAGQLAGLKSKKSKNSNSKKSSEIKLSPIDLNKTISFMNWLIFGWSQNQVNSNTSNKTNGFVWFVGFWDDLKIHENQIVAITPLALSKCIGCDWIWFDLTWFFIFLRLSGLTGWTMLGSSS